jgi:hypothetical protein
LEKEWESFIKAVKDEEGNHFFTKGSYLEYKYRNPS